ncbi:MAG: AsmA family protein [Verrucomicrobia bacterium]|nr:AsmA family protein [Verrucomicrobiota bacterium]
MKKIIVRLVIALLVVVILAMLAVGLFLDRAIKTGVETFGPKLAKVDVKLQSVSLSLLSGSGTIKGLVVGNPAGFKTPSAISVGTASLSLKPGSLLSDKIVIKSINVQGPEITFETDLKGNNLSKILANVQESTGGGAKEPAKPQQPRQPNEAKPPRKLQVDDFVISGGMVHVSVTMLGGQAATIPLPEIHLQDLGKGPEGITPGELSQRVLEAVEKGASEAAAGNVINIGKGSFSLTKDGAKTGSNAVESITKGVGNLFKKK